MKMFNKRWFRSVATAVAILLSFSIGLLLRGGAPEPDHLKQGSAVAEATVWTCSMHPQIRMPEPGQCPICGMDLIPLQTSNDEDAGPRSLTLAPMAQKIAEVETAVAVRRSAETNLRMVGKLEPDETRVREISAWVSGRIDRLYIDYTGVQVREGEELFDLYSPELYSAQEELLQAIRASRQLSQSTLESTRVSATRTVDAARKRLLLWGLTPEQVEEIEVRSTPSDHVTILAPMSGVVLHKDAVEGTYVKTGKHVYSIADLSVLWLKLDVYESDLAWVKLGQPVAFETDTYSGETFEGTVSFVDPMLNERSRSVKVRVDVPNRDGRLKPGMFARAVVHAAIGGQGDIPPIVIPASAPLVTGTRAVVYIEDPTQKGRYSGREIVLGPRAGDSYVVREGLQEGEIVVSNGAFKIDSALQILAKKSMMNPEGGGPAPGHHHGSSGSAPVDEIRGQTQVLDGVPEGFRKQVDCVVAAYFQISRSLGQDDLSAAKSAAAALSHALDAVDHDLLPHAGHEPWERNRRDMESASHNIAEASDIAKARRAFHDLSDEVIETVRIFHTSGQTPILVYHCPMAMDGAGADWLQSTAGTKNPYYGSQMFKCGSQTETLVAGSEDDSVKPNSH